MSISVRGARGSGRSGINALNPFPRAGLLWVDGGVIGDPSRLPASGFWLQTLARCESLPEPGAERLSHNSLGAGEHLPGKREIRFRSAGLDVVQNYRHPVARRLAQPHVARDD